MEKHNRTLPLLSEYGANPPKAGNQKEGKMERHYETVYIVKPDIGEDAIKGIVGKAAKTVEDGKGTDVEVREWGRRKLAYPIQKLNEGYYFHMIYTAPPPASKELERTLRLNEDVIRYQTVRLNERPPVLAVPPVDDGGSDKVASGSGADAEPAKVGGSDKVNADVGADAKGADAEVADEGGSDKVASDVSADAEAAREEGKKGGGDGE